MKAKIVESVQSDELLLDDLELLLREIDEFCAAVSKGIEQNVPDSVENYLLYVAKTGNTVFPWPNVRPLFRFKLKSAIAQFQGEPSTIEPYVYERFDTFRSAPFTIQRLSELITSPNRHYKVKEKFVSALEKTVFVVSTVEPKLPGDETCTNGTEENNTSSSDDGTTHDMNISFDNIQPSDYNNAIGLELPSESLSTSETEGMNVSTDSIGDAVVDEGMENVEPKATTTTLATDTNGDGFTIATSADSALVQDSTSFQAVQNSSFNQSQGAEFNEQISSLGNVESSTSIHAAEATTEAAVVPVQGEVQQQETDIATSHSSNEPPKSDQGPGPVETLPASTSAAADDMDANLAAAVTPTDTDPPEQKAGSMTAAQPPEEVQSGSSNENESESVTTLATATDANNTATAVPADSIDSSS